MYWKQPPAPEYLQLIGAPVQLAIAQRLLAAAALGLKTMHLPSGAGHDAQAIARIAPMGMIFVPSVAGISHSPRELSRWGDCANGADVLLQAVLCVDREKGG